MGDVIEEALAETRAGLAEGNVYERAPMLTRRGGRWKIMGRRDHTRIRLVGVPDGQRRTAIRYRKLDPKPMGNGRPDRGVHTITLRALALHYVLVTGPDPRANEGNP